jgi:hypothetical protein
MAAKSSLHLVAPTTEKQTVDMARRRPNAELRSREHLTTDEVERLIAAPNTGVNTITGEGLKEAMAGAQVVIDLANSPSFEDKAVLEFFETSGRNLLAAEAAAGIRHHVEDITSP